MKKSKTDKFENDDYSRIAGPDFKEEHRIQKPFNGGISDELKNQSSASAKINPKTTSTGPDQATIRDLGIEYDHDL